jgi:hypothetical protein
MIPTAPAPTFATAFPFPGAPAPARQEGKGKDAPHAGRLTRRAALRRTARLRRAAEALGRLPSAGEAVHFLIEAFFDPCDLLAAACRAHPAPCDRLRTSTLSFSACNVRQLAGLIDAGLVRGLTLLCSDWMKDANARVYALARQELAEERGATVAAARCHAKVSALHFADGATLVFEGSGNLSSCRTVEQVTAVNDPALAAFHAAWIDRLAQTPP